MIAYLIFIYFFQNLLIFIIVIQWNASHPIDRKYLAFFIYLNLLAGQAIVLAIQFWFRVLKVLRYIFLIGKPRLVLALASNYHKRLIAAGGGTIIAVWLMWRK